MKINAQPTVFWDFDGTLAYREGLFYPSLLKLVLDFAPGLKVTLEELRPHLKYNFPWHTPDVPHLGWTSEHWWSGIEQTFSQAFEAVGVESSKARELARSAHLLYVDPASFILYDDSIPTLRYLQERGWRHIILSNHVPELPQIVEGIGLGGLISRCLSSASVGYEKPNPQIFLAALEAAGHPEQVWMVGDRIDADVKGAEKAGIKAILVRSQASEGVTFYAEDLWEAGKIIHPQD